MRRCRKDWELTLSASLKTLSNLNRATKLSLKERPKRGREISKSLGPS